MSNSLSGRILSYLDKNGYPYEQGKQPDVYYFKHSDFSLCLVMSSPEDDVVFFKISNSMFQSCFPSLNVEAMRVLVNELNRREELAKAIVDSDNDLEFTVEVFAPDDTEGVENFFEFCCDKVLSMHLEFQDMIRAKIG